MIIYLQAPFQQDGKVLKVEYHDDHFQFAKLNTLYFCSFEITENLDDGTYRSL